MDAQVLTSVGLAVVVAFFVDLISKLFTRAAHSILLTGHLYATSFVVSFFILYPDRTSTLGILLIFLTLFQVLFAILQHYNHSFSCQDETNEYRDETLEKLSQDNPFPLEALKKLGALCLVPDFNPEGKGRFFFRKKRDSRSAYAQLLKDIFNPSYDADAIDKMLLGDDDDREEARKAWRNINYLFYLPFAVVFVVYVIGPPLLPILKKVNLL